MSEKSPAKAFRVLLKDGRELDITATSYKYGTMPGTAGVGATLFAQEENGTVASVRTDEIIAVIPKEFIVKV